MSEPPLFAQALSTPEPWRSQSSRLVYASPWIALEEHTAVAPTGRAGLYTIVRFANAAAGVLPIDAQGHVHLVGQQRFPFGEFSWEMPEGGAPKGEDPLDGAKRELLEETGLIARGWTPLVTLMLSNSICDERAHCYLAYDLERVADGDPDPTEAILQARVPFRTLLDEIKKGKIQDSMTVAAAFCAYHMAREGELPADLARAMLG